MQACSADSLLAATGLADVRRIGVERSCRCVLWDDVDMIDRGLLLSRLPSADRACPVRSIHRTAHRACRTVGLIREALVFRRVRLANWGVWAPATEGDRQGAV